MRSGSNSRRSRGRGNSGRGNRPQRSNSFDSNGPDVKVRGSAKQVVDKYQALAREAATAGDPVKAENYYQHAEHYYRAININAAAENKLGQQQRANKANGQTDGKNDHESSNDRSEKDADSKENQSNQSKNPDPVDENNIERIEVSNGAAADQTMNEKTLESEKLDDETASKVTITDKKEPSHA
tara:strand:+ start:7411 stop:7962 length:552 start_codon:yes stop_codon:yes gene_type:complete